MKNGKSESKSELYDKQSISESVGKPEIQTGNILTKLSQHKTR